MARIRSINPSAPTDEDVATMSVHARLVWAYLPCHADRMGRLVDKPFGLKLDILPTDAVDMNAILDELAERRHIIRYQVDGRRYIQIQGWSWWQVHDGVGRDGKWRRNRHAVLERDGFVCQSCGVGGSLDVHHKVPMRKFDGDLDSAHEPSNLISLCRGCHAKADADFRRRTRRTYT